MNVADVWGALVRRWYILVIGMIVAAAAAYGAWSMVAVEHTRTATQLLLPGPATIPDDANPFLYVGGLSQAADVLVRKMGSPDALEEVLELYPDADIAFSRDPLSSGPVVQIAVTLPSDDDAGAAVDMLLAATESTLLDLQSAEGISARERITLVTLTIDDTGTVEQRGRLIASGVSGAGVLALTLLMVALIDGLARSRRQRRGRSRSTAARSDASAEPHADDRIVDQDTIIDGDADAVDEPLLADMSGPADEVDLVEVADPDAATDDAVGDDAVEQPQQPKKPRGKRTPKQAVRS